MSGGMLWVLFHVVPIALSGRSPQEERGNVAALMEGLNATVWAEGRVGSFPKTLDRPLSRMPGPGS